MKIVKIEHQDNEGHTWRFDYPGWGKRITFDDGSILYAHYDEENQFAAAWHGADGKTFELEAQGFHDLLLQMLTLATEQHLPDEKVYEVVDERFIERVDVERMPESERLEVDWNVFWYADQKWRPDPGKEDA